jgi:hypothetical protein
MSAKSFLAPICIVLAFVFLPSVLLAQGPGNPGPDPDPGTSIPFDGGISMLIAAGIGYASKKAYDKRKEKLAANK